jgi:hypothetical protein
MVSDKLTFVIGRPVSAVGIFFSLLLVGFGLFSITMQAYVMGLLIVVLTSIPLFLHEGSQVDPENGMVRQYFSFWGIKIGKWQSLDEYKFICLLRSTKGQTTGYNRVVPSMQIHERFALYEICLLNESHHKRLLMARFKTREAADAELEKLSVFTVKPVVAYNPVRSVKRRR